MPVLATPPGNLRHRNPRQKPWDIDQRMPPFRILGLGKADLITGLLADLASAALPIR